VIAQTSPYSLERALIILRLPALALLVILHRGV